MKGSKGEMGVGYDGLKGDKGSKGDIGPPGPASHDCTQIQQEIEAAIKGEPCTKGEMVCRVHFYILDTFFQSIFLVLYRKNGFIYFFSFCFRENQVLLVPKENEENQV